MHYEILEARKQNPPTLNVASQPGKFHYNLIPLQRWMWTSIDCEKWLIKETFVQPEKKKKNKKRICSNVACTCTIYIYIVLCTRIWRTGSKMYEFLCLAFTSHRIYQNWFLKNLRYFRIDSNVSFTKDVIKAEYPFRKEEIIAIKFARKLKSCTVLPKRRRNWRFHTMLKNTNW